MNTFSDLQWRVQQWMLGVQGQQVQGQHPMTLDGIDQENGVIDVYKLLPKQGDSIMIVNCGSHFEVRHQSVHVQSVPPALLTDEEIEKLKQGQIIWN